MAQRKSKIAFGGVLAIALIWAAAASAQDRKTGVEYERAIDALFAQASKRCDAFVATANEVAPQNELSARIADGVLRLCSDRSEQVELGSAMLPSASNTSETALTKSYQGNGLPIAAPSPGHAEDTADSARAIFRSASSIDADAAYELLRRILGDAPRPVQN